MQLIDLLKFAIRKQSYKIRFSIMRKKGDLEIIELKKYHSETDAIRAAAANKQEAPDVRFFVMKEIILG